MSDCDLILYILRKMAEDRLTESDLKLLKSTVDYCKEPLDERIIEGYKITHWFDYKLCPMFEFLLDIAQNDFERLGPNQYMKVFHKKRTLRKRLIRWTKNI